MEQAGKEEVGRRFSRVPSLRPVVPRVALTCRRARDGDEGTITPGYRPIA